MTGKLNFYKKIKNEDQVKKMIYKIMDFECISNQLEHVPFVEIYRRKNGNFGFIQFGKNYYDVKKIAINSRLHVGESFACLIDTFAHEIAHIYNPNHDAAHKRLTNVIKKLIKNEYAEYYCKANNIKVA